VLKRRLHRGFTLIEVMVVVTIIAVFMLFAMPEMNTYLTNSRTRNAAQSFKAGLMKAQAEAIRINNTVAFVTTSAAPAFNAPFDVNGKNWFVLRVTPGAPPVLGDVVDRRDASEGSTTQVTQTTTGLATATTPLTFNALGGTNQPGAVFFDLRPSGASCAASSSLHGRVGQPQWTHPLVRERPLPSRHRPQKLQLRQGLTMLFYQNRCNRNRNQVASRRAVHHRGMMLIEVMVAVLILVIGLLGLMAAFAKTTSTQTDVDNRATAARLTQSLLSQMMAGVPRTGANNSVDTVSLNLMAHNPTPAPVAGVPAPCTGGFGNAPSADPVVIAWLGQVTSPGGLPGATAATQQVFINPVFNEVTVTVCWQASGDVAPRQHVQKAYIN
jgi:type IV pilus assembly protein PilV